MQKILEALGVQQTHSGVWTGDGGWLETSGDLIESVNPATGEVIGRVRSATATDYERVIASARKIAAEWRKVPAPKRGEAVRLVGDALRAHKNELGTLVTLETGKIKAEGDGEVQEMIDIADFALGQSRMLYGNTMHSERPMHRMCSGIPSASLESSARSTSRWLCGPGTLFLRRSAAMSACGSHRPKRRFPRSRFNNSSIEHSRRAASLQSSNCSSRRAQSLRKSSLTIAASISFLSQVRRRWVARLESALRRVWASASWNWVATTQSLSMSSRISIWP
jgi:Aldehyde dehydrogenase family